MVAESSPPIPFNGTPDPDILSHTNNEILTRSSHLVTIIQTIEKLADSLPDSSLTKVSLLFFTDL